MIRIDGAYLYSIANKMNSFLRIEKEDYHTLDFYMTTYDFRRSLEDLVYNSVFSASLKVVLPSATKIIDQLNEIAPHPKQDIEIDWDKEVPAWKISSLQSDFRIFEAILQAELTTTALYFVSPKGGYDTSCLVDDAKSLFPASLSSKVPECSADIIAAAKCIAFDLPTAAAFHLHRAHEAVLRKYWTVASGGRDHPDTKTMGSYLKELEKGNFSSEVLISYLKSIKDFHRNPIMHPDDNIETMDQAIDLLSAIRCSIGYMLREMPEAELESASPVA